MLMCTLLSVPVCELYDAMTTHESVHTLPLSVFRGLKCSKPSLVASQKTSDEESLLDPESSDDLSAACEGGQRRMKAGKHLEDVFVKEIKIRRQRSSCLI